MIDCDENNNYGNVPSSSSSDLLPGINGAATTNKRKRRPAGTPDPDAEVVSLSPRTLLESDQYVCEICNQGFQRDQNLQMHRRRHKVPWKLLKREKKDDEEVIKKRVYVCPEQTCLHHDPCHALGDLVGIKKHFRRKHSVYKQWVCERCSKGYAVQSDYKAHLKTCGSRGHSCDCGRVFSRVESFIEHQDTCTIRRPQPTNHFPQHQHSANNAAPSKLTIQASMGPLLHGLPLSTPPLLLSDYHSLALANPSPSESLELQLSIGMGKTSTRVMKKNEKGETSTKEEARKAGEMRQEAKRQIEIAENDFENAKRIRKEAKAELEKALAVREEAIKRINTTMLEITCHSCRQLFQLPDESTSSLVTSYLSSATTEGECE